MKMASNRKNKTTFTFTTFWAYGVKVVLFFWFEAVFMPKTGSRKNLKLEIKRHWNFFLLELCCPVWQMACRFTNLTKWWHFDNENSLSNCHDKFSFSKCHHFVKKCISFSKCRGRWGHLKRERKITDENWQDGNLQNCLSVPNPKPTTVRGSTLREVVRRKKMHSVNSTTRTKVFSSLSVMYYLAI